jgi:hypothetical protein
MTIVSTFFLAHFFYLCIISQHGYQNPELECCTQPAVLTVFDVPINEKESQVDAETQTPDNLLLTEKAASLT